MFASLQVSLLFLQEILVQTFDLSHGHILKENPSLRLPYICVCVNIYRIICVPCFEIQVPAWNREDQEPVNPTQSWSLLRRFLKHSVVDPFHFHVDPDPQIHFMK